MRRHSSKLKLYEGLIALYVKGRGDENMMIASPDSPVKMVRKKSPYYYIGEWDINGGVISSEVKGGEWYEEPVAQHPIKTVKEWCEYYGLIKTTPPNRKDDR